MLSVTTDNKTYRSYAVCCGKKLRCKLNTLLRLLKWNNFINKLSRAHLWHFITQFYHILGVDYTTRNIMIIRGGDDKSLAWLGRKQITATKLGIYSAYSPRSSIHFLSRCYNFRKSLKKKSKVVRPTRSPRQQWAPCWTKNDDISVDVFSPENRWQSYGARSEE
jgi:hypothetical protein